jgi:hypothetical protein
MERIRWNDAEKQTIAQEVQRHLAAGEKKLRAIELAQKALPKARRRHIKATTQLPWLDNPPSNPFKQSTTAVAEQPDALRQWLVAELGSLFRDALKAAARR